MSPDIEFELYFAPSLASQPLRRVTLRWYDRSRSADRSFSQVLWDLQGIESVIEGNYYAELEFARHIVSEETVAEEVYERLRAFFAPNLITLHRIESL